VSAQSALAGHEWPEGVHVKVRMGVHTGEPSVGDEGYVGLDVVRAARICSAGHGGQILMSETTRALMGGDVPDGWSLLASSNPQTGEAQASASAYVIDERKLFTAQTDFVVLNAFSYGGKDPRPDDANLLDRVWFKAKRILTWPFGHPTHYAVVQLQQVVPQETQPGQAPPLPKADETKPVVSVIMVRDLGAKRLPSVGVMLFSGIVFAVCCNSLHRRDKLVAEARAAAARA
jgi:hypothetical protein